MVRLAALFLCFVFSLPLIADVSQCACDPKNPETLKARECSLCAEAQKQPTDIEFFILKDSSPRKPNRWLALPRVYRGGSHPLHELQAGERARLWKFAIAAAKEHFGEDWGLAYNGEKVRTQCHLHIHIGKFVPAAEKSQFKFYKRVEDFPAPTDSGLLIHPVRGGFRVLTGEQIMETGLVR